MYRLPQLSLDLTSALTDSHRVSTPPVSANPFALTASMISASSLLDDDMSPTPFTVLLDLLLVMFLLLYSMTCRMGANTSPCSISSPLTPPGSSYTRGWNRRGSSTEGELVCSCWLVHASVAPLASRRAQCSSASLTAPALISGPTSVLRSMTSLPTRRAFRPPAMRFITVVLHPASSTSTRAELQRWPAAPAKEASTASHTCSGRADESATNTFRPPVSAHSLASGIPLSSELTASWWLIFAAVAVDPTKDTPAKAPDATSRVPASEPAFTPGDDVCVESATTVMASSCMPARRRTSTRAAAHLGAA
mmetsp:Transcript_3817/g.5936  ORF Transcript_3817/g.5936 Transcript_3817/m.5936 type:complete len:308 (-) Transcript_3817:2581-3504(-)